MYDRYLFYDKPIPYKSLLLYPATMEDYIDFHVYVNCLLLDKNSIPNVEIIKMSYLRYIYYEAASGEETYLQMLKLLLCMILHKDINEEIKFYIKDNQAFFSIDNIEYNADDLEKIKEIIFQQNCIAPIDDTIQKELRDEMLAAEEYKLKQNANKICSLEEQMICVLISTPLKLEDIYKLTIRKFNKVLQRVDHKLHYEIYLSAQMSGMVTFKDKNAIQHWMNDLSKQDRFSDVKVDMDAMRNKVEGADK